ncbi:MAG: hypothetical protein P1V51_24480 [Deltaproteobacteria bacterium]|nr:hypothetical protein [Deltaproteobacteria bacterium]
MSLKDRLATATKEVIRWNILRYVYSAKEVGVLDRIITQVMVTCEFDVTLADIRGELHFLRGLGLVEIEAERDVSIWVAKITSDGTCVVEYAVPCPVGLSRPKQEW